MSYDDAAAVRLRTAIELADATLLMMREHFRREWPTATEAELTELVNRWLAEKHRDEFAEPGFSIRHRSAGR